MKGKNTPVQRTSFSIFICIALFLCLAFTAATSVILYWLLSKYTGIAATIAVTVVYVAVISFVFTLAYYFYRRHSQVKPVKNILKATNKMAKGDYKISLKPCRRWGRYGEYDVIADNLSRMAKELENTDGLSSDFIANVSHEIKTPLTVIQNYAQEIKNGRLDNKTLADYCDILVKASSRLTSLVGDILKLNKLENQSVFPEKQSVDVAEQLRLCILSFEDKIEQKGLELECFIDECSVVSDGGLLELIWNNLLSNAIKFTNSGAITVTLKDEESFISVCVKDTGCGMDYSTGQHIFDKFYQGDTSHAQEGNGLGLALVKRVIDILGGEIMVDSRLNGGSAFTVKIKKEPS